MNEIFNRFKAETPIFWKKAQKGAITIAGSAIAVLTANSTFSINLPVILITVLGYLVAVCAAVAGTAQLTKTDNNGKS